MTVVHLKNISFLSMETIIRYMDPVKLFRVAIVSESFHELVMSIKVPVDEVQISVGKPSESFVNCIGFNCRETTFGRIGPILTADRLVSARINGNPMKLHETIVNRGRFEHNHYGTESCSLAEVKDFSTHLMRLFDPKKSTMDLRLSASTIDCFTWKIQLNTIHIICTSECRITWKHLKRVIENVAITEVSIVFQYSCEVYNSDQTGRDFEIVRQTRASLRDIPKMIKCKKLKCDGFDIFSVDDLINSECKRIDLCDQEIQMTNSELNTLLKAWKTGEHMTYLERFYIDDYDATYNRTLKIVGGIELYHGFPTHPLYIVMYSEQFDRFDNKGGFVIKRDTDGTLATVMIGDWDFKFVVWKDELVDLF